MGLRITTWNVNGIRNPFAYQPWREKKTFAAMFDILEADIVIFQETKIQRKDLRDDMVLVPGWDCYFSLPRHKKGYSGVVIYTRQTVCAPIRAEEGVTGVLCQPGTSTSYQNLPYDEQIGGYPTALQAAQASNISDLVTDFATIDSEGRCVILEFPAFVLIGVYSPANRDEARDDFRLGFLCLLDARVRNLVAIGKRVFLAGDLNISKEEVDTANAESAMRKNNMTNEEYYSTPARRILNQMLDDGKVPGQRDSMRSQPVLWDICRGFHLNRKGMFTCWETKVNARPGNFGARIDYVLCSLDMKTWFSDSNIQEGLMGSDHCPVYAITDDEILLGDTKVDIRDVMNPPGMFREGSRLREYSTNDMLPLSGRLIKEFDGRQSIRDMFARKPTLPMETSWVNTELQANTEDLSADSVLATSIILPLDRSPPHHMNRNEVLVQTRSGDLDRKSQTISPVRKRRALAETSGSRSLKRTKSGSIATPAPFSSKGQQSLKGFFRSLSSNTTDESVVANSVLGEPVEPGSASKDVVKAIPNISKTPEVAPRPPASIGREQSKQVSTSRSGDDRTTLISKHGPNREEFSNVHDPIESKESWSKLFARPTIPRCESHNEPCISFLTKKPGINCGRSFWMCSRPLGPTGIKERNTQWRCQTFIWCSDWTSSSSV